MPIFVALMLYIHIQAQLTKTELSGTTEAVMFAGVAARYLYALGLVSSKLAEVGATLTYVVFIGLLISAASYSV